MIPLAVSFGRWPLSGTVVTVATVLDDPDRPHSPPALPPAVRCRRCGRTCRHPIRGLGSTCARRAGITAAPRARRRRCDDAGPDLLDLLDDEPEDYCE